MPTSFRSRPTTPAEVFTAVSEALQDSLGVDEEEVTLNKSIPGDLGAESIDFLDIIFRVEKNAGVKVWRTHIFPDKMGDWNPPSILTEEVLTDIRGTLPPYLKLPDVQLGKARVADLFTVRLLCQLVAHNLEMEWQDPS